MNIQIMRGGEAIADANGSRETVLSFEGEYQDGDSIHFDGLLKETYYIVKVDSSIEESFFYTKTEHIVYTIPFGEKKTSYDPAAFTGIRHYIRLRMAEQREIESYRNLARNAFDQHDAEGIYPHASANVETRGEAVFAARNAIDGIVATASHGEWPYESWGINRQEDAEIQIDFGRPVDLEEIRLYTRADFPHDNWWTEGTFSFSDGSFETVKMEKKVQEPQVYKIQKENITWIRLGHLVKADDPSPFPALTQIEAYGYNCLQNETENGR